MDSKVWSSRAILSHPNVVRETHEDFIAAGAEVIINNTFSAARHTLEPGGLGLHVKDNNQNAVELVRQARDKVAREPAAIAGSVCEWVLDDPKWNAPEAIGRSTRERVGCLAEAGVDLIALEMCERSALSVAVTNAALEIGLPVWIGVSAQAYKGRDALSVFSYAQLDFESLVSSCPKKA